MSETCATCRFWRVSDEYAPGKNTGICRRKFPNGPWSNDDDWCGEHQPREPEQPKAREPGWYWTRYARESEWNPARFDGECWRYGQAGTIYRDEHFAEIGPRLEPPA